MPKKTATKKPAAPGASAPLEWPPLPELYHAPLGPVSVRLAPTPVVTPDGDRCGAYYSPSRREIVVGDSPSAVNIWFAYWHEVAHAELGDQDVNLDAHDYARGDEERVCNAWASARLREMRRELEAAAASRPARRKGAR